MEVGPEGTARPLKLKGGCFCGAVAFSTLGPPLLSAYCHCTDCQRLMGCPFTHTMHFKEVDFFWSRPLGQPPGVDYYENPCKHYKRRFRCKQCGSPIASFNTRTGQYSVWGASLERAVGGGVLEWERIKPTAHQFYGTRLLDVNDELGKWEGYEAKSEKLE